MTEDVAVNTCVQQMGHSLCGQIGDRSLAICRVAGDGIAQPVARHPTINHVLPEVFRQLFRRWLCAFPPGNDRLTEVACRQR